MLLDGRLIVSAGASPGRKDLDGPGPVIPGSGPIPRGAAEPGFLRNLPGIGHILGTRCALNPYEAPRAELFWMSPQEQLQARLGLSARRWALLVALTGTVQVAAASRPGLLFLLVHGAAAALCLAGGAAWAAGRAPSWLRAPWPQWASRVLLCATALVAVGLLGILGAAQLLGWLGHPTPYGPIAKLTAVGRSLHLVSVFALAGAACATWSLAWRWRLGRPD